MTILLSGDEVVRRLNAKFRAKDAPTNVLSFPAPTTVAPHLGDIALAYGVCAREAAEQGKSLAHHLMHLTAHGVLHLLGYDHETDADAEVMEAMERDILAALGVADPYALDEPDVLSEDRHAEPTVNGARRRSSSGRKRSLVRRLWALWVDGDRRQPASTETLPTPSDDAAAELVDHAEAFASLRVSDVMTPRADVAALEISTPLSDVVRCFVEVEHSRMPIYRETLDDPVGFVHIKDLFKLIAPTEAEPERAPRAPWKEPILHRLKREMLYVPASMRAADLLVRMRAARIHMAMVIDEYGGADGLVTLEDLIEAVVGEIDDEHDEETSAAILSRPGGLFEAEARAPMETLDALLGVALAPADAEEDIDTVGGLVVALAGRVPQRGEVIVHPAGYEFEVMDADPRRVRRVRIRPPSQRMAEAVTGTKAETASVMTSGITA